jgi:hypothetical protein
MWQYTCIAQERVEDRVRESERYREAQAAQGASGSVARNRPNMVLNRVTSSANDLTARVTNAIKSCYPSRRHTSRSAAETQ